MPPSDSTLAALGLERVLDHRGLVRDPGTGTLEQGGNRTVAATLEFLHCLRFVLEKEGAGTWASALKTSGVATGKAIGAQLDFELTRQSRPTLSALPLEACLALLESHLGMQGWGHVKLDLTDAAEHGLIVARLENSALVEALPSGGEFVDPLLAGVLSGFFQHLSGEPLGCEEIACARRGADACVFVITAEERLAPIVPLCGRESPEAIIARLKT